MHTELGNLNQTIAQAEINQQFGLGRDNGDNAQRFLRDIDFASHLVGVFYEEVQEKFKKFNGSKIGSKGEVTVKI